MLLFCWFAFTSLVFELRFFKMEAENSLKVVLGADDLPFPLMSMLLSTVSTVKVDSGMTHQL